MPEWKLKACQKCHGDLVYSLFDGWACPQCSWELVIVDTSKLTIPEMNRVPHKRFSKKM